MAPLRATQSLLKDLRSLTKKKGRAEKGVFIVEGWKPVEELLNSDWTCRSIIVSDGSGDDDRHAALLVRATARGVKVLECTPAEMETVTATEHSQGILSLAEQRIWTLEDCSRPQENLVVALEAVGDPGNVGTLVRTADWFGSGGVLLSSGSASLYNEKVVRSTSGSLFHIPCLEVADLGAALDRFRALGYHIVGTDAGSAHSYTDVPDMKKVVLVLGNEARGISPAVREKADLTVHIPRRGKAESLNVALAGAILLSHFTRNHGLGEM